LQHCIILLVKCLELLARSEKKRYAPYTRKRDHRIYYTAEKRILTAAYPRDDIKIEYTDATPVKRTDYRDYQGYPIYYHEISSFETVLSAQN